MNIKEAKDNIMKNWRANYTADHMDNHDKEVFLLNRKGNYMEKEIQHILDVNFTPTQRMMIYEILNKRVKNILDEFNLEFDKRTAYPNGKDADWQTGWNDAVGRMVIIKSDIRQKYLES